MKTNREKMLAGELYDATDTDLVLLRRQARDLCKKLNTSSDAEAELRREVLTQLLGSGGDTAWIEPPFFCDYGFNIRLGNKVFFNFNCVILDVCPVTIGDRVLVGPAVQFYGGTHPLDAATRGSGLEYGRPITIGDDVWLGGAAIICPGVTIGNRAVIGAGSVVTKDIPPDVIAAGNPCRVLRENRPG